MFEFKKSKRLSAAETLKNRVIADQSFMYDLLTTKLEAPPGRMRKIEFTYFSLALLTYRVLRFYRSSVKEQILDDLVLLAIEASIPLCGEEISFKQAVTEYQQRYKEYDALLRTFFTKTDDPLYQPPTRLLMHLYERVTQDSAKGKIVQLIIATRLIFYHVTDNIEFVKKEMPT